MKKSNIILFLSLSLFSLTTIAQQCAQQDLDVVVLGSGGPEIQLFRNNPSPPPRASASYLVREKGKAAFLVDFGTGALQNFARSGAKIEDVKGILITHFHVDHINDLPALVKASFFSSRHHDLAIYGPTGNEFIPDTEQFITRLLGEKGAYSYLSGFLTGDESYQIQPTSVPADKTAPMHFHTEIDGFQLSAIATEHGLLPALAWRIEKGGCRIVFSGDTSNQSNSLDRLVQEADLFIAHNAVPETSQDNVANKLHMRPSEIARIAQQGNVKNLLLSHLMRRTEHVKAQTKNIIQVQFDGKIAFANDCDVYTVATGIKKGQCDNKISD
ncbi:MBL fold metallo-hydrolase [Pasteurella multocida]|uniref:MBL fold metallo-hydrolase n=1 Tax=Pasteurella multocida TaxID=747 RepID=UPI0020234864|nr:MBL fold metallo-hydrolase [Pasteurella multocida]MEB3451907.1 MBL fold metallo-hydrolase [Pasteurella multocida]MEB3452412.1 MBL fold metallo-hydrolase [Pasteurella multocida]MEB3454648.1 MBL fold metallo-hydrolase [Pasteurella multocida]MEB3459336.1 MBL fold metallo-hydrolase [Pasteurella multocida]MEB3461736.1 MBL fold metallo-hydrolase [Pasteurella multocida]